MYMYYTFPSLIVWAYQVRIVGNVGVLGQDRFYFAAVFKHIVIDGLDEFIHLWTLDIIGLHGNLVLTFVHHLPRCHPHCMAQLLSSLFQFILFEITKGSQNDAEISSLIEECNKYDVNIAPFLTTILKLS